MRRTRLRASVLPGTAARPSQIVFDEPNDAPARPAIQVCNRCDTSDQSPLPVRSRLTNVIIFGGFGRDTPTFGAKLITFVSGYQPKVRAAVAVTAAAISA